MNECITVITTKGKAGYTYYAPAKYIVANRKKDNVPVWVRMQEYQAKSTQMGAERVAKELAMSAQIPFVVGVRHNQEVK